MFDLGTIVALNAVTTGEGPRAVAIFAQRVRLFVPDLFPREREKAFNRRVMLYARDSGLPLQLARRILASRDAA